MMLLLIYHENFRVVRKVDVTLFRNNAKVVGLGVNRYVLGNDKWSAVL